MTTEAALMELLTEPVSHIPGDSGGAYGYNHEINAQNPPDKRPEWIADWGIIDSKLVLNVTHNLYHYLLDKVEYDEALDKKFQKWAKRKNLDPEDMSDCPLFPESLLWHDFHSHNMDHCLSQHFVALIPDDWNVYSFAVISVHGGCDLRAGYTHDVLFRVKPYRFIRDVGVVDIRCENCSEGYWYSYDGGCLIYNEFNSDCDLHKYPVEQGDMGKQGVLVVKNEDTAFCPICGKGRLLIG